MKSSGHAESVKHRTGYKNSGPTERGNHRTIEQAVKVAGPKRKTITGQ